MATDTKAALAAAAKPGNQTSEFSLANFIIKVAAVVQVLALISVSLPAGFSGNKYAAAVIAALATLAQIFAKLGYTKSRTDVKTALIDAVTELDPPAVPVVESVLGKPDVTPSVAAAPVK